MPRRSETSRRTKLGQSPRSGGEFELYKLIDISVPPRQSREPDSSRMQPKPPHGRSRKTTDRDARAHSAVKTALLERELRVLQGDCAVRLRKLDSGSVDLIDVYRKA